MMLMDMGCEYYDYDRHAFWHTLRSSTPTYQCGRKY